jgi:hypothetical protein
MLFMNLIGSLKWRAIMCGSPRGTWTPSSLLAASMRFGGRLADEQAGASGVRVDAAAVVGSLAGRYRDQSGVLHTGPHTFTSKADAARYLALVEADLHRGTWADPKLGPDHVG